MSGCEPLPDALLLIVVVAALHTIYGWPAIFTLSGWAMVSFRAEFAKSTFPPITIALGRASPGAMNDPWEDFATTTFAKVPNERSPPTATGPKMFPRELVRLPWRKTLKSSAGSKGLILAPLASPKSKSAKMAKPERHLPLKK